MVPWLLALREDGASARSCDFLWSQVLQVDPETRVRACRQSGHPRLCQRERLLMETTKLRPKALGLNWTTHGTDRYETLQTWLGISRACDGPAGEQTGETQVIRFKSPACPAPSKTSHSVTATPPQPFPTFPLFLEGRHYGMSSSTMTY